MHEDGQRQVDAKEDLVERLVKSRTENDRISCQAALEIATELGISPALVGKVLNRLKIRVTRCQLGCF